MGNDDGVIHRPGTHSELAALRVLLTNAGVAGPHTGEALSEDLLYGLSGGLATGAMAQRYELADVSTLWLTGWNPFGNSVDVALERLGIAPAVQQTTSPKAGTQQLQELLARGGPVMAWLDEATLGHTGLPAHFGGGSYHAAAVYEADEIWTRFGDRAPEPFVVETPQFLAARTRIRKYQHRTLWIGGEPKGPDGEKADVDVAGATAMALHEWAATPPSSGLTGTFSLDALNRMAARVHDAEDSTQSWSHVFPPGVHLWGALAELYRCVEWWGSGGGLMRPRFAGFLVEASVLLENDALLEIATTYRTLGTEWSALASGPLVGHPLLARTREAVDASVAPILAGEPDAAAICAEGWAELDEIRREIGENGFPLDAGETDALLAGLQSQLRAVVQQETDARAVLTAHLEGR